MRANVIAQTVRFPFLVLTLVCVFLGVSIVVENQSSINPLLLILTMSGALFAHTSVNTLNEYFDFKSGLDFATKRTKFSGGSGALPENPDAATTVLFTNE